MSDCDVSHWYRIDGPTIAQLHAVTSPHGDARIINGRLLLLFNSPGDVEGFERRCREHGHKSIRTIERDD